MHFIYIFLVIIITVQNVIDGQEFTCSPNFCLLSGDCPKFECKGKENIVFPNTTKCGCCNTCVKELKEDDICNREYTGNLPPIQCGPHLMCDIKAKDTIVCRKISDVKEVGCEREAVDMREKMGDSITAKAIPVCDEYGEYSAKQCKNGSLCHCVNTNGTKIFGSTTYDNAKDMDCLCSRQFSHINEQLKTLHYQIDPVYYLRCKSNGNYEPFQSVDNFTYCVNTTNGELIDRPVNKRDSDQLPCSKHKYDFNSQCMTEFLNAKKEIEKLESEGYLVVGYDVPKCDLDGTYAPVQCLDSYCFCVNKKGEKYRGTQVDRNDPYYGRDQNCTCVREKTLIGEMDEKKRDKVTELFSHYVCERNGDYLPLQCSDSVCYCVDPFTGFQLGKAVLKSDVSGIKALDCWKSYNQDDIQALEDVIND